MVPPTQLPTRKLGRNGPEIPALGLGLMGMSVAYGKPGPDEERLKVLDRAWELGCVSWDTAHMYGDSEELVGKWFALHPERRGDVFLATKFGLSPRLETDSSPGFCRAQCETSLRRLGCGYVDLFYIHRVDGVVPVEKTIAAMAELKREGKIRHLGICAPSSTTLRRACAVEHVDAVQVEYSPWSLEIEGPESTNLLQTCRELGVATFAYSPLGRGFMTGQIRSPDDIPPGDLRRLVPRFNAENFPKNLLLVDKFKELAARKKCTPGQLALAWLMAQGDDVIPIPGTKNIKYLEENVGAAYVRLSGDEEAELRGWVSGIGVSGLQMAPGIITDYGDTPPLE